MTLTKPTPPYNAASAGPTARPVEQREMLECLNYLGRILIASSRPVAVIQTTLEQIAGAYGFESEVVALPNLLLVRLGGTVSFKLDVVALHAPELLRLDQAAELAQLLARLQAASLHPAEAVRQIQRIMAMPNRYGPTMMTLGYVLAVVGLALRLQADLVTVLVSSLLGVIAGLVLLLFKRFPRYAIFSPVIAALLVALPALYLIQLGWPSSLGSLIVPSLAAFLPGAILATSMIELASADFISGSSRLIYGLSVLLFLFVGLALAGEIVGLTSLEVLEIRPIEIPWWTSFLGTALFGIGNFMRLSGRNRDLLTILLVLYLANFGQIIGETYFNPYMGAFLGALVLAMSAGLIARTPGSTPAFVSETLAFWFLVPGSSALLSITFLMDTGGPVGAFGFSDILLLIVAVALGDLLGTTLVSQEPKAAPGKS